MTSRREVLRAATVVPLGLLAAGAGTAEAAPGDGAAAIHDLHQYRNHVQHRARQPADATGRPHPRRGGEGIQGLQLLERLADERKAMLKAQQETGLKCVSLVGTGTAGGTTGFTRPGAQDALLAEIKERVDIAKEFGTSRI